MNEEEPEWEEVGTKKKKRKRTEMVPDSLHGLQVCRKFGIAVLLLLQLPPDSTQLLLSLHFNVIGHHHRSLEVCLKASPLLLLILNTQTGTDVVLLSALWILPNRGKHKVS